MNNIISQHSSHHSYQKHLNKTLEQQLKQQMNQQYHNTQEQQPTLLQHRINQYKLKNYDMLEFQQLKKAIYQEEIEAVYYGMIGLRKLLSKQQLEYTINLYFNSQIINKIIEHGRQNQEIQLKKQAFDILSQLAFGSEEHIQILTKYQIINLFLEGLVCNNTEIIQSSLLGVDNLIIDNPRSRDAFINHGIINILLQKIQKRPTNNIANMSITTICNLIRVQPVKTEIESLEVIAAYFCWYMRQSYNQLRDQSIIWAFTHLTHNRQNLIKLIIDSGLHANLVEIASNLENIHLKYPTFKLMRLILTSSNQSAQKMIEAKIINTLELQINNHQQNVRSEIYQIIILLGSIKQTQSFIYSNDMLITKLWDKFIQKGQDQINFRSIGSIFMRPLSLKKTFDDNLKFTSACFFRQINILKTLMQYLQIFKSTYCTIDCLSWIEWLLIAGKNYSKVGVWVEDAQFLDCHGDKIVDNLEKDTVNDEIKNLIKNIRAVRESK